MNTGIAFATKFKMEWMVDGEVVEREFSLLDSYSTNIPKISLFEYLRLNEVDVKRRSQSIIEFLCKLYDVDFKNTNEAVEKNLSVCPLINQRKEVVVKEIETSLVKKDNGVCIVTDTDEINNYYLNFIISELTSNVKEVDYLKSLEGELIAKVGTSRNKVVFDINDNGELIVIGDDANKYELSEQGELLYNLISDDE